MTPSQSEKRIAIAEHFGWKKVAIEPINWDGPSIRETIGEQEPNCREEIPQYFTDLNACALAENALSVEDHELFRMHLRDSIIVDPNIHMHHEVDRAFVSAPAQLRAEALWLTLCSPEKQPAMKPVSPAGIAEMNKILFQ